MPGRDSNVSGLARTLRALEEAGRLGDEDQAIVSLTRGLAAALDDEPGNAALAREYRQALLALAVAGSDTLDDDAKNFLISISTPGLRTQVRHPEVD